MWRHTAGQEAAVKSARAVPDAEYRHMFISLIDPTAMVRTYECLGIAERIGAYSATAG